MSLKFVAICGGIFVSFWVMNLLQERLYKTAYGPTHEKFSFVVSLIFFTTSINCLSSFAVLKLRKIPVEHEIPSLYKYSIGVAYLLATVCSLAALKWVSYPAQVLAKSAKPVPVLFMGVLIGKKSYHYARYIMVLLIVVGLVLFKFKDGKSAQSGFKLGAGELLLGLSLLLDGVLNSLEERTMSEQKIHPVRFMFDVNVAALFFVGLLFVLSGEIFEFACFAERHPIVVLQMLVIAICTAVGQFFIFGCITEFGTLTCSIVTTTRKFFTVLSSVVIFRHVLGWSQWLGVGLVFGGLALDVYYGKFKSEASTQNDENATKPGDVSSHQSETDRQNTYHSAGQLNSI